jgi:hypothetical protein
MLNHFGNTLGRRLVTGVALAFLAAVFANVVLALAPSHDRFVRSATTSVGMKYESAHKKDQVVTPAMVAYAKQHKPKSVLAHLAKLNLPQDLGRSRNLWCDRRIIATAKQMVASSHLAAMACYGVVGFSVNSDHALGLALDLAPTKPFRGWANALKLARRYGWDPACNQTYCVDRLASRHALMRAISFMDMGCGAVPPPMSGDTVPRCVTGIHFGWVHSPTDPSRSPRTVGKLPPLGG